MSDIRCLTSEVCCHIAVIRHRMSMMFVVWYQTSHVRCHIPDPWYDTRLLITVIRQQSSDVRRLLSYDCYQTSDVIFLLYNCYQLSDVWYQMSNNSYMTADVGCAMLYNCYQTSDVRRLTLDVWHITVIRCLMSFVWYQTSDIW